MFEDFQGPLDPRWSATCVGGGSLTFENAALRMALEPVPQGTYADAQIDDYARLRRAEFPWRPPLRMEVRARASHPAATRSSTEANPGLLRGTAGFGFWNYPFSIRGDILMLPEAIWFFYASPPSNMALVPDSPGWGWKAQIVHSQRPGALAALLPTGLATLWGRVSGETQPAARWLQRLSGAHEALLTTPFQDWHHYALEWRTAQARFFVDNQLVLEVPAPPTRPLGFVAWLDNQYAIATPRGVIRFGSVATQAQWLEISALQIERL